MTSTPELSIRTLAIMTAFLVCGLVVPMFGNARHSVKADQGNSDSSANVSASSANVSPLIVFVPVTFPGATRVDEVASRYSPIDTFELSGRLVHLRDSAISGPVSGVAPLSTSEENAARGSLVRAVLSTASRAPIALSCSM